MDSSGTVVVAFDTGPNGQATISVKSGSYRLQPVDVRGPYIILAGPTRAVVEPDHITVVTIHFGSGLR